MPFLNTIQHQSITALGQARQIDAETAFTCGELGSACAGGLAFCVYKAVGDCLYLWDGEGDGGGAFCWIRGNSNELLVVSGTDTIWL